MENETDQALTCVGVFDSSTGTFRSGNVLPNTTAAHWSVPLHNNDMRESEGSTKLGWTNGVATPSKRIASASEDDSNTLIRPLSSARNKSKPNVKGERCLRTMTSADEQPLPSYHRPRGAVIGSRGQITQEVDSDDRSSKPEVVLLVDDLPTQPKMADDCDSDSEIPAGRVIEHSNQIEPDPRYGGSGAHLGVMLPKSGLSIDEYRDVFIGEDDHVGYTDKVRH